MAKKKTYVESVKNEAEPKWVKALRYSASAILIAAGLGLSIASNYCEPLSSPFWSIFIFALLFVGILFMIFCRKKQLPLLPLLYVTVADCLIFLPLFVSAKICSLVTWLYALLGLGLTVFVKLKKKKDYELKNEFEAWVFIPALLCILPSALFVLKADFDSGFAFWLPCLIVSCLAGVIMLSYCLIRKKQDKGQMRKKSKYPAWLRYTGFSLTAFFFAFLLAWDSLLVVNVCFDFSQGEVNSFVIVDKDVDIGTRHVPTTYNLKIEVDGDERSIKVPKHVYDAKEIGSSIEVSYYGGLLGESYYIYAGYVF